MRNFNVSQRQPAYYKAALSQNVYIAANQAAVATTAALATTYTGLVLQNTSSNTKKAALLKFGWAQTVAGSADGAVGLMGGATTATMEASAAAAITPRNMYTGSSNTSVMVVDDGCTIATPVLWAVLGSLGTLAVTGYGMGPMNVIDFDGSIIINPGYFIAAYCTKATTASLIFFMMWEEF